LDQEFSILCAACSGDLIPRGDGQSFIVKNATRLAPKKLIHREANPAE
jgi:hypothetical protein